MNPVRGAVRALSVYTLLGGMIAALYAAACASLRRSIDPKVFVVLVLGWPGVLGVLAWRVRR